MVVCSNKPDIDRSYTLSSSPMLLVLPTFFLPTSIYSMDTASALWPVQMPVLRPVRSSCPSVTFGHVPSFPSGKQGPRSLFTVLSRSVQPNGGASSGKAKVHGSSSTFEKGTTAKCLVWEPHIAHVGCFCAQQSLLFTVARECHNNNETTLTRR